MNKGFRAGHGQMWLAGDDANRQPGQLNRPCRLSYRLRDRSQGEVGGDPGAHVGDHGRRPGTDSSVPQSTCKPFVQPDVDICHDLHGDGRRERVLRHPQTCVEPAAAQALVELVRRVVGSGFTDTLKPLIMVGCAIADRERPHHDPCRGAGRLPILAGHADGVEPNLQANLLHIWRFGHPVVAPHYQDPAARTPHAAIHGTSLTPRPRHYKTASAPCPWFMTRLPAARKTGGPEKWPR
jgi:hypothetical protein